MHRNLLRVFVVLLLGVVPVLPAAGQYLSTVEFDQGDLKRPANTTPVFHTFQFFDDNGTAVTDFPAGRYEVVYLDGALKYAAGASRKWKVFDDQADPSVINWEIVHDGVTATETRAPGDDADYETVQACVDANFGKFIAFSHTGGTIKMSFHDDLAANPDYDPDDNEVGNYFLWAIRPGVPDDWDGPLDLVVGDINIYDDAQLEGNEAMESKAQAPFGGVNVLMQVKTPVWALVPDGLTQGTAELEFDLPPRAKVYNDDGTLLVDSGSGAETRVTDWDANQGSKRFWIETDVPLMGDEIQLRLTGLKESEKTSIKDGKTEDKAYVSSYCPCGSEGGSCSGSVAGSLVFTVDLGRTRYGESAGYLQLVAETYDASKLHTSGALQPFVHEDLQAINLEGAGGKIVPLPGTEQDWGGMEVDYPGGGTLYRLAFYHDLDKISNGTINDAFRVVEVSNPVANTLRVVETQEHNGTSKRYWEYKYVAASGTWEMEEGQFSGANDDPLKVQSNVEATVNATTTTKTITIKEPGGTTPVSQVVETWTQYAWGREMTRRETGTGAHRLIESWVFDQNASNAGYGRKQWYYSGTGYWEGYVYEKTTLETYLKKTVMQLDDNEQTSADPANAPQQAANIVREETRLVPGLWYAQGSDQYTFQKFKTTVEGEDASTHYTLRTHENTAYTEMKVWDVVGTVVDPAAGAASEEAFLDSVVAGTADDVLVTLTTRWPVGQPAGDDSNPGDIKRIDHPDGQVTRFERVKDTNLDYVVTTEHGYLYTAGTSAGQLAYGTKTTQTTNVRGSVVQTFVQRAAEQVTVFGGLFTVSLSDASAVDAFGRPTTTDYYFGSEAYDEFYNGTGTPEYSVQQQHGCCGSGTERKLTDRAGILSIEMFDGLGRLVETTPADGSTAGDIRTQIDYDAADRVLQATIKPTDNQLADFVSRTEYDDVGRVILTEDAEGRRSYYTYRRVKQDGTGDPYTLAVSGDPADDAGKFYWERRVYGHDRVAGASTPPVRVTWTDSHGRVVRSWTGSVADGETWTQLARPDGTETLTEQSRTVMDYTWADWNGATEKRAQVKTRVYHALPAVEPGAAETNYREVSTVLSDPAGRPFRVTDAAGNLTETVYEDGNSRVSSIKMGVDASNLKTVELREYEEVRAGVVQAGNQRPWPCRVYTVKPGLTTAPNPANLGTHYVKTDTEEVFLVPTSSLSSRTLWTKPQHLPWSSTGFDVEGRVVSELRYENDDASNALSGTFYTYYDSSDAPAGPYNGHRDGYLRHTDVKPNDGDLSTAGGLASGMIRTTNFYDDAGRAVKTETVGRGFTKVAYDAYGRVLREVSGAAEGGLALAYGGSQFFGDDLLTERVYELDDTGRVLLTTSYDRRDDRTASTSGLLSALGTGGARVTYSANWYDPNGRPTTSASYGDNRANNYAAVVYANLTEPTPSDATDVVVSTVDYDLAGRPFQSTDNGEKVTRTWFDAAHRPTYVVENYESGAAYWGGSLTGGHPDAPDQPKARGSEINRITQHVYDDGPRAGGMKSQQVAIDPDADGSTADNQATHYIHSGELDTESRRGPIPVNGRAVATLMPDAIEDAIEANAGWDADDVRDDVIADINSGPSGGDFTLTEYTADGRTHTMTDRRGVEWTYAYTPEGWLDHKRVSATGGWTAVGDQRVQYAYGPAGEVTLITCSSDAAGNTDTSTIAYDHDGYFNVTTETQDHDAGGPLPARSIERSYDTLVDGSNIYTKAHRLDTITYPNGREVRVQYSGNMTGVNDAIGRPSGLYDVTDAYTITEYDHLGSGRMARKRYPEPSVRLDWRNETGEGSGPSGTDPYDTSWDTLGRQARCQWETYDGSGDAVDDLIHITHAYDGSSNRLYDHRRVYTLHATAYRHDAMNRIAGVGTGLLKTDVNGDLVLDNNGLAQLDDHWALDDRDWTLDQLNNPTQVDTAFDASDRYGVAVNDANEIETRTNDAAESPDELRIDFSATADKDVFTDRVNAANGNDLGTEADVTGGSLVIDANSSLIDEDNPALLVAAPELGHLPYAVRFKVDTLPASTERGLVGYVFGYTSPTDFWVYAKNMTPGSGAFGDYELYHMHDDDASGSIDFSDPDERKFIGNVALGDPSAGTFYTVYGWTGRNSVMMAYLGASLKDQGGFPGGRVGLYTEVPDTSFDYFRHAPAGPTYGLGSAWEGDGPNRVIEDPNNAGSGVIELVGNYARHAQPVYHKHLRANRFEVTFKLTRSGGSEAGAYLVFDDQGPGDHSRILVEHHTSPDTYSVRGYDFRDGELRSEPSATKDHTKIPPVSGASTPVWFRVVSDGSTVTVYAAATEGGLTTATACYSSSSFPLTGNGRIGFAASHATTYLDDITIKTDPDNDLTGGTPYEATEIVEGFPLNNDDQIEDTFAYDGAGNLLFDGSRAYTYDARNRVTRIENAYRSGASYATGSVLAAYQYDGKNRRIVEKGYTADGLRTHLDHYCLGASIIETRDRFVDGGTLKPRVVTQYVWDHFAPGSGHYVDALAEVGHNVNLGDEEGDQVIDRRFYALQADGGGQANVLGLVDEAGRMIERYEYTLYGQRKVYRRSEFDLGATIRADFDGDGDYDDTDLGIVVSNFTGPGSYGKTHAQGDTDGDGDVDDTDTGYLITLTVDPWNSVRDPRALTPSQDSQWIESSGVQLCVFGFQGLRHDASTGTIDNRARLYLPGLERFAQRDPLGYPDGMNTYAAYHVLRQGVDPSGMGVIKVDEQTRDGQTQQRVYHVPEGLLGRNQWDDATFIGWLGSDERVTLHPKFMDKYGFPNVRPRLRRVKDCGSHNNFDDVIPGLRRVVSQANRAANNDQTRRSTRTVAPEVYDYTTQRREGSDDAYRAAAVTQAFGQEVYFEGGKAALTAPVVNPAARGLFRGGRALVNTVRSGDGLVDDGLRVANNGRRVVMAGDGMADDLLQHADNVIPRPGYTDVFFHATEDSFKVMHNGKWVNLSHRDVANWVRSSGIQGDLRLISCNAGAKDLAQDLSNTLNRNIMAADTRVGVPIDFESPPLLEPGGSWHLFRPGKR